MSQRPRIAIVGRACIFPDATSPDMLFENALAGRRSFRRIPEQRLRLADYRPKGPSDADCITAREAALIEGWSFDRVAFRIAARTYETTDLAHWLALDVAARALSDAGCPRGEGLDREGCGVIAGNTLTGEFSRAANLRLRWPFAGRILEAALSAEGWEASRRQAFLAQMEERYKAPFPPPGDESLAGSLSNTIAGRVCNYFDFGGGGFTVDGACSASLLAVAQACSALEAGDLEVALAGGVDLSLDPFELVGFARVGAIATGDMRVYDADPTGFLPGEGCGFVVLMREDEALRRGFRPRAWITGWGISSDGAGGLTRPETRGQALALRRAYRRAGFGPDTVAFFEGHGTGTAIGDEVELSSLIALCRESVRRAPPAALSSIKANIGHTKAAAGIAGLLKAALAVETGVLPPVTACERPHPRLLESGCPLRVLRTGEAWPRGGPRRAGVTALGFGGINVHVVIESAGEACPAELPARVQQLCRSAQDAELVVLGAPDRASLRDQVRNLRRIAGRLSRAEVSDVAAALARGQRARDWRAAVVASTPDDLEQKLGLLESWLSGADDQEHHHRMDLDAGIFLGQKGRTPRVVYLFPGQAAPAHQDGGAIRRRFAAADELYAAAHLPENGDSVATEIAQPAIVTASLAGLRILRALGLEAQAALGHSLGELTALFWAGALGEDAVLKIARDRGRAMAATSLGAGAMAQLSAGVKVAEELIAGTSAVIAGRNGSRSTVISGPASDVERVVEKARAKGVDASLLRVSHAFHSPLVAPAAGLLADTLRREQFRPVQRLVISTITGRPVGASDDLREMLIRQVTSPVLFQDALLQAASGADLLIEVGPGHILRGLCATESDVPIISLDAGGPSLRGLLSAAGATYALGATIELRALFSDRFTRPFDLAREPVFFRNPCEAAPIPAKPETSDSPAGLGPASELGLWTEEGAMLPATVDIPFLIRRLVSERAQLPLDAVKLETRLLQDLHLNSITVGELVGAALRKLGLKPPVAPTEYSRASVGEIARALAGLLANTSAGPDWTDSPAPAGLKPWVGTFVVASVEVPMSARPDRVRRPRFRVLASPGHPLAEALRQRFGSDFGVDGVAVCLPRDPGEAEVPLLLAASRAMFAEPSAKVFLMVQNGGGAASFARTFHLETGIPTKVFDLPEDDPRALEWIEQEVAIDAGFSEIRYDTEGRRRVPNFRALEARPRPAPLCPDDVLLVSGGGKGIAAECALRMAERFGPRLVLLGRARLEKDAVLSANLKRFAARGLSFVYLDADVTDAPSVRKAVRRIPGSWGPVTALLHGAGTNEPRPLRDLDESTFASTLAPKVQGFRNLLSALDPQELKLVVGFGSIIARTGLPGEADYGLANEWLTRELLMFQRAYPGCRVLPLEWSVWSGTGMGERLGRIEALARQGIAAITADRGVEVLTELLESDTGPGPIVVTGRLGRLETAAFEEPGLPLLRFLEKPLVHYPRNELVVEISLSTDTDLYLRDHRFGGSPLVPAVLGLEAMAQVAAGVAGVSSLPVFEAVEFAVPVVVPEGHPRRLRLVAVRSGRDGVEVALRSEETGFQVDHFRARCRFGGAAGLAVEHPGDAGRGGARSPLDPRRALYGSLLFHTGRFVRVEHYEVLKATTCTANLAPPSDQPWFSPYLPAGLLLGDAAARDAALHAIQACIPHATILPVGADEWQVSALPAEGGLRVIAREKADHGDVLIYDVDIATGQGRVIECVRGLRLKVVAHRSPDPTWPPELWSCYLERRTRSLLGGIGLRIGLERVESSASRPESESFARRVLGPEATLRSRPDGRPEVAGTSAAAFSTSRADGLMLGVAGEAPVACDVELVGERGPETWRALLGGDRYRLASAISERLAEPFAVSATRLWSAGECLKKSGWAVDAPLMLERFEDDGWVVLAAGSLRLLTYSGPGPDPERRFAFVFLVEAHGPVL